MKVRREDFLRTVETVRPGLSPRGPIVAQSDCIALKDGSIFTFNGEVCCRFPSPLDHDIVGAVPSGPILNNLTKWPDVDVDMSVDGGKFVIRGKNRELEVKMEKDVLLPVDHVEEPGDWRDLPDDFTDAITMVEPCAGREGAKFVAQCIHFHPKWLEATDNNQIARYRIVTGVESPILLRADCVKHLLSLDMTEISESPVWAHFRNPSGLVLSCQKQNDVYPPLGEYLKLSGDPTAIPKGLADAATRAGEVSKEDADRDQILVEMRPGKVRITGQGETSRYREWGPLRYDGEPMTFVIAPKLLSEIVKRYNDCQVCKRWNEQTRQWDFQLKVSGEKFVYVASLGKDADKKVEPDKEKKR